MKVRELIAMLQARDPELEIIIPCAEMYSHTPADQLRVGLYIADAGDQDCGEFHADDVFEDGADRASFKRLENAAEAVLLVGEAESPF